MKASDLVWQLREAIAKHGDHELLFTGNYGEDTEAPPEITVRGPSWKDEHPMTVIVVDFDLGS